jgi:hypothetical protein
VGGRRLLPRKDALGPGQVMLAVDCEDCAGEFGPVDALYCVDNRLKSSEVVTLYVISTAPHTKFDTHLVPSADSVIIP